MAEQIPERFKDLFSKRAFAHLATIMPDGSPQVSPVWVGFDGTYVIINSAQGRQKDRNMRRNARVAVEVQDPDDPYRYILVRGRVAEVSEEGAEASIDELAVKYTGSKYKGRMPGMVRVIYKIEPEHIKTAG
jgi:PPOX class probable F420-dependent enzyme